MPLTLSVRPLRRLYRWSEKGVSGPGAGGELSPECGHHGHILALFVESRGDFIVVGDLMKSISLLAYKQLDGSIEEIARDYNANWMTAIDICDDASVSPPSPTLSLIHI